MLTPAARRTTLLLALASRHVDLSIQHVNRDLVYPFPWSHLYKDFSFFSLFCCLEFWILDFTQSSVDIVGVAQQLRFQSEHTYFKNSRGLSPFVRDCSERKHRHLTFFLFCVP